MYNTIQMYCISVLKRGTVFIKKSKIQQDVKYNLYNLSQNQKKKFKFRYYLMTINQTISTIFFFKLKKSKFKIVFRVIFQAWFNYKNLLGILSIYLFRICIVFQLVLLQIFDFNYNQIPSSILLNIVLILTL